MLKHRSLPIACISALPPPWLPLTPLSPLLPAQVRSCHAGSNRRCPAQLMKAKPPVSPWPNPPSSPIYPNHPSHPASLPSCLPVKFYQDGSMILPTPSLRRSAVGQRRSFYRPGLITTPHRPNAPVTHHSQRSAVGQRRSFYRIGLILLRMIQPLSLRLPPLTPFPRSGQWPIPFLN